MIESLQENNVLFSTLRTNIQRNFIYGPSCLVRGSRVVWYVGAELSATGRAVVHGLNCPVTGGLGGGGESRIKM